LVATGLAALAAKSGSRVALVDCDVEAPNDHLFVQVDSSVALPVFVPVAEVDAAQCTGCGTCRRVCAFGAPRILGRSAIVFEEMCHGCGLCTRACPEGAIHELPSRVGEIVVGYAREMGELQLFTGRLDVGQVKTPPIIRQARSQSEAANAEVTVLDAPPGVACSAVESVRGADVLLLVTEPTPFGLHDLALALQLGVSLGVPMGIVLNRDVGPCEDLDQMSAAWAVPILARIPFQRHIAEIYAEGGNAALEVAEVGDVLNALLGSLPDLAGEAKPNESEDW
jgi:MinD superfamily P-loop ATPase